MAAGLERFSAVRRFHYLGSVAFSPDGEEVAYAHDGSGQFNLYRQAAAGAPERQLTRLTDDAVRHVAWTRHGLIAGIDHHGDEQWQLYLVPAAGGDLRNLTGRQGVQYQVGRIHPDGDRISFGGNGTRPQHQSVYVLNLGGGEIVPVCEAEGNFFPGPWHPDGRRLVVGQMLSNTDQDLFLLDPASGERRPLTSHSGEELNLPVGFRGDHLYLMTDRGRDHAYLARLALAGGAPEPVWQGDWSVEAAVLDAAARRLAFVVNEGGLSSFHVLDLESGQALPVPELPAGHCLHFDFAPDGRRLAGVIGTGRRPFDVYVADLEAGTATRLTESFQGGIPDSELAQPELVHFPTFDGRQVPAWLYRPAPGEGRIPVLVSIHGGPEAQERPGTSTTFTLYQWLVSRGIAVLAPNIRGSSGYDKAYQRAIHRDWGGGELRDIRAAAEYLRTLDWVDRDRLAVYGGSFGGFASLSAMTRLHEYWACGVDLFGPSDLVTFARAVPPFWRALMRAWVGDPDDDREMLLERSPITYVDQFRAPLLVLQGATDPRVVRAESDQMVARLRALGRHVEYVVFEDEGHGFTKQANQQRATRTMGEFLLRHLGVEP